MNHTGLNDPLSLFVTENFFCLTPSRLFLGEGGQRSAPVIPTVASSQQGTLEGRKKCLVSDHPSPWDCSLALHACLNRQCWCRRAILRSPVLTLSGLIWGKSPTLWEGKALNNSQGPFGVYLPDHIQFACSKARCLSSENLVTANS